MFPIDGDSSIGLQFRARESFIPSDGIPGSRRYASPRGTTRGVLGRVTSGKYDVAAVHKALDILDALAGSDGLTLNEIVQVTGIAKTSAFRIVTTLEGRGYVDRRERASTYAIGARALRLAQGPVGRPDLRAIARPHMESIRNEFGDTVNLAVLRGGFVVYVDVVEGSNAFRFVETPGSLGPVHATALGKAMLAQLPPADLEAVLGQIEYRAFTAKTITDPARLREELKRCASRGFATDDEETEPGARCIAAPILDGAGRPVAGISLSGSRDRLRNEVLEAATKAIRTAAAAIAAQMFGAPAAGRPPARNRTAQSTAPRRSITNT